jgi:hypothetical protein
MIYNRTNLLSHSLLFLLISCNTGINNKSNVDYKNIISSKNNTQFISDSFIVSRLGTDNSPYTSVEKMIGADMVTIKYYSLNIYDKNAENDIIKYNKIWKISDYAPMLINVTSEFYICNTGVHEGIKHHLLNIDNSNDHTLIKAGKYSLYILPKEKEDWILFFNKEVKNNNKYDNYNPSGNIASIKFKPYKNGEFEDQLSVQFYRTGMDSSIIKICFGDLNIPFKIVFKNSDKIYSRIMSYFETEQKAGQPIQWDEYMEAADYCGNYEMHLDKALTWIDSAISLQSQHEKQNSQPNMIPSQVAHLMIVKANILSKLNKFSDATECLNVAYIKLNSGTGPNPIAIAQVQKQIEDLKTLTKK